MEENIGSLSDLNDQEVLLINDQLIENAAITVQLSSFEGEPHLGGPQPTPQTTEAVIVTGGIRPVQVQQPAAVVVDQNLQFTGDNTAVVYDVEAQPAAVTIDQNLQFPGNDTAVVFDVEAQLTLVPNRSDPIERLRFIAASTLFYATMVAVLFLPRDIHGVHTTYGVKSCAFLIVLLVFLHKLFFVYITTISIIFTYYYQVLRFNYLI